MKKISVSTQLINLSEQLKEFDEDDFETWWLKLPTVKAAGPLDLIQYLDMKKRKMWVNKKFEKPKEVKNG